jgi:hypothetical protein
MRTAPTVRTLARPPDPRLKRRRAALCSGVAALLALAAPASMAAAKSSTHGATFKLTGALQGTLHVTANDCSGASSQGVSFYSSNKLKGPITTTGWTITIISKGSGTFKLHQGELEGVTISSDTENMWGFDANGTLTIKGGTGKVSTELSSTNAHKVHIAGSWNCPTG